MSEEESLKGIETQIIEQQNSYDNEKNKISEKQNVQVNKGYLLEYRIRRILYHMGYFVKGGIILRTSLDNQPEDITDLDVLGILINKNFSSSNIWADCKAGKAKPLERITWLNGIKAYFKLDEIIFVKKGIRLNIKEFARKQSIQVLDTNIIDKLEKIYCIDKNDYRGSWDHKTQTETLKLFQQIDVYNKQSIKRMVDFINCEYWSLDNYRRVKKSITAMKQLAEIIKLPITSKQLVGAKWAIYENITLFMLATLNICKEIYYLEENNKKEIIYKNLSSGVLSERQSEEFVNASYRLAYSLIKSQIPDFNEKINPPKYEAKPPIYFDAYHSLILRITNNPLEFYDILRFLDIVLMEYDLKSKSISKTELEKIFSDYDKLLNSSKTILHFICSVTNLPKELFQLISK